jgi:hypothetical protein
MARVRIPVVAIAGNATLAGASMAIRNRDTSATIPVYAAETGATTLTLAQQVSDAFGRFPGWTDAWTPVEATITPPAGSGLAPWVEAWDAVPDDLPNVTPPDGSITSAKIADGTIVAGDIADGAVTSAKIADGTIVAGDIADGAVTSAKIADGTIVSGDIADGTIQAADLAAGVAQKPITRSSSKPASPADGDLWEYPANSEVNWLFRWSASLARWECIGGVPLMSYQAISETRPDNGAYGDTATVGPSYTIPFAGRWAFWSHVALAIASNYGTQMWVGQSVAGGGGSDFDGAGVKVPDGGHGSHLSGPPFDQSWTVAASAVVKTQYKCLQQGGGGYTASFSTRRLYVMPLYLT